MFTGNADHLVDDSINLRLDLGFHTGGHVHPLATPVGSLLRTAKIEAYEGH